MGILVRLHTSQLWKHINRGYPLLTIKIKNNSYSRHICIRPNVFKILNSAYICINITSQ